MSTATTTAEWLTAGGIGAGTWAVLAVLIKVAADAPGPDRPAHRTATPGTAAAATVRTALPPSAARHAGPPARDEASLLAALALEPAHRDKDTPWN
ncbi:hypothetical protein [Streptomyces sp. STCH 565 A]|uniref:hypothetical protein n=1 Tax=Streptomyces sp. STCH 565 A TaxID=2950532 RepID=UPI00207512CA|nr:hypothetical protein [Streptomyces sp. STCH 565 A]MCM8548956.1 hypothetical protein [Streptomyces sp. STCH 565 A]